MRDGSMQGELVHELAWESLSGRERVDRLRMLPRAQAEELFLSRTPDDQVKLLESLSLDDRRSWLRVMAPDDAADLLQRAPVSTRSELLSLLDEHSRQEVRGLLAYADDEAGGLMSPRYARLRPHMTADEAITYLRRQARERLETVYYVYVLDEAERLLGVVSFRELFAVEPSRVVRDVMRTDVITRSASSRCGTGGVSSGARSAPGSRSASPWAASASSASSSGTPQDPCTASTTSASRQRSRSASSASWRSVRSLAPACRSCCGRPGSTRRARRVRSWRRSST